MNDKIIANFTTTDEQIEILKRRGLIFNDEIIAKELLQIYGYYNLINGYKDPYVSIIDGEEFYKEGIYFEQILSLFILDAHLRYSILSSMLLLEEHLRSVTSYVIGEHFGSNDMIYLRKENYKDRHVSNPAFSLDTILSTMKKALRSSKDPIRYHREKYHNVPPWILVKGLYMNTLINFIRFQKKEVKEELIQTVYGIDAKSASLDSVKELFSSTLFLALDYRNMAAHGGRTYNFCPKTKLRLNEKLLSELQGVLADPSVLQPSCNLNQLLYLLSLFKFKNISLGIENALNTEASRHFSSSPNDFDYISQATGLFFKKEE